MKTIFKTILAVLATAFIASCSDVPAPYNMPGEGGNDGGGSTETSVTFFSEDFSTGQGNFTIDNKTLPAGSNYVWKHATYNTDNYMIASGYVGGKTLASESWLVSPVIDLTKATTATLKFSHACNKFADEASMKSQISVQVREENGEWATLSFDKYGSNAGWTFVDATADMNAYVGKKVQFAFKYTSSDTSAGSWEVKNISVVGTGETGENGGGNTPDVPSTGQGDGTKANPYDIEAAQAKQDGTNAWVKAYIVGSVIDKSYDTDVRFGTESASKTNVIIAASASETDKSKCIPVQLPTGEVRNALNLAENASMLGKEVLLYGQLTKYFGVPGLKSVTAAVVDGQLIGTDPDAGGGETPEPTTTPGTLTKASNLTEGTYAIGYYDGSLFKLMTNVIPDGSYYGQSADWTSGEVPANCQFKITKSGNNWVIQGADGKYVYVQKNGTHYNLKFDGADSSVSWTISDESDGVKAVYGDMTTNWLAYSTQFKTWQMAYSGTKNAVYPSFYKIK